MSGGTRSPRGKQTRDESHVQRTCISWALLEARGARRGEDYKGRGASLCKEVSKGTWFVGANVVAVDYGSASTTQNQN